MIGYVEYFAWNHFKKEFFMKLKKKTYGMDWYLHLDCGNSQEKGFDLFESTSDRTAKKESLKIRKHIALINGLRGTEDYKWVKAKVFELREIKI